MRRDLAGDFQAAFLGFADQQDFFAQRDMRDVHAAVEQLRHQQHRRHAAALGVCHDGQFGRPALEMRQPQRHVVQAQWTVGLVEVHLQPGGAPGQTGRLSRVIGTRAQELGVIAARLARGRRQRQLQRSGIGHRRFGVGHGQHQREAACQRGGRAAIPILFVLTAGFAQVYVRVDQAGQFDHKLTSYG